LNVCPQLSKKAIVASLVSWHREASLPVFPWRGAGDPYLVLVAELLLRQTTREQVLKIWPDFVKLCPDAHALRTCRPSILRETLRPLGLVNLRVAVLRRVAKHLEEGCDSSSIARMLEEVSGVGEYTVASVLCLAFGAQVPMIDVNAKRVLGRVLEGADEIGDARALELFESLKPMQNTRAFNLALIDFAHYVCKAKVTACSSCKLRKACSYYNRGATAIGPLPAARGRA
jgi:A/G-specific adenine glycosylase